MSKWAILSQGQDGTPPKKGASNPAKIGDVSPELVASNLKPEG